MTDCLLVGFNDIDFKDYVELLRSMGTDSGAWRDLNLTFLSYQGKAMRSMDVLNHFRAKQKQAGEKLWHNADFLWPVILYLGTYLQRRDFSFDYVNLFHLEKDKLRDKLLHTDVRTVAITTTLYVAPAPILEIVDFIRSYNDRAQIIVGGPYIHNQTVMMSEADIQKLFAYLGADYYVISQEGEATLAALLNALKRGTPLTEVPNLAFHDGNRFVLTPRQVESNPLEENMVDYGLFPPQEIGQFISLRTAKSCPFSCAFCGFPQRAGRYTYNSVELIEHELNMLHDLGVRTLTFLDDTFNVPKARYKEILKMMINNGYAFHWNAFYRCDHGDNEVIKLMAEAGCEGVFLGAESGSDAMLARMNKAVRRHHFLEAIPCLQENGISCHTNFIVGFPGETEETVAETVDLIEQTRPDYFRAQLWYADPMTPVWKQRQAYGIEGEAFNWSHNTMNSRTACELVDQMFLSVQGSVWLPQYGFEQWSTFYLQRQGMTREQIKHFVSCFNTAVKHKLLYPHQQELDPALLEELQRCAQFEDNAALSLNRAMEVSATNFKAARAFWLDRFGRIPQQIVMLAGVSDQTEAHPHEIRLGHSLSPGSVLCDLGPDALGQLVERTGQSPSDVLLAAFCVLLMRVTGQEELQLVITLDADDVQGSAPLRLRPSWSMSFTDFLQNIREEVRLSLGHRRFAMQILDSQRACTRMPPLTFDVGFCSRLRREASGLRSDGLAAELAPAVQAGIQLQLLLEQSEPGTGYTLRMEYHRSAFTPDRVQQLADYLAAVVQAVAEAPETPLGELPLESQRGGANEVVEIDAEAEFTF